MNVSAILFRDIKLLLKFIKYITVVFTQNNGIIRFLFFLRAGSSDSLSDPLSWSSDSKSESVGALSSPLASFFTLSNAPKLLNPLFISRARPEKASLRRAATSVVELGPGVADCCKPLPVRRSCGALFPFEECLGFVTVFVTTTFFEASEPLEGAFSPFFFSFASHLSDFAGSLVPGMGSAFVDSEPQCFSARVLFDHAEISSFRSLKLASKTESNSWKLSVVVAFANCDGSSILTAE